MFVATLSSRTLEKTFVPDLLFWKLGYSIPWVVVAVDVLPAATFIAGLIGLLALAVLNAGRIRTDPWQIRDRAAARVAAWVLAGGLLSLSLHMVGVSLGPVALPVLFPTLAAVRLARRRAADHRRRADSAAALGSLDAFPDSAPLDEDARAARFRAAVFEPGVDRIARLRAWLPVILAQRTSEAMEAAVFRVLEELRDESTEALLVSLLESDSPRVQVKAAHLLAWFGTPNAVERLRSIAGPGSEAAEAAIARIKNRHAELAEPGRVSLACPCVEGAVSLASRAGALSRPG